MPDVTVVESRNRGKAFWVGLLVGILAMLFAVIVLWLLGVIDIGGKQEASNEVNVVENETSNLVNSTNDTAINATDNVTETDTIDNVANEIEEEDTQAANVSPFYVDAVLARDVDDQANPVDETSVFATDDDRIYVVISLKSDIPEGTEVGVEWFQDDAKLSDFATDVDKGQTVAYFFTNNPGDAGEYSVKILIDGKETDELKFSVE